MAHRVKQKKATNVHEQSQIGNWSDILKSKKQYQHHKSKSLLVLDPHKQLSVLT